MKYNFDEIIERRGTNSYKWDLVIEFESEIIILLHDVLLSL